MFIVSGELLDRPLWLKWLLAICILSPKLLLILKKAYNPPSKLQQPLIIVNNGLKPLFFCWTSCLSILALNKIIVALCRESLQILSWFLLLPGEREGPKHLDRGVQVAQSQEAHDKGQAARQDVSCKRILLVIA